MKLLLLIALLLPVIGYASIDDDWIEIHGGPLSSDDRKDVERRAKAISRDIERRDFGALAEKSNLALRGIMRVAVRNLKKRGFKDEAKKLQREWRSLDGTLIEVVSRRNWDIGDFAPLNQWLAVAYEILELKLGYDLCRLLRLSDIKTINYAIPVVFKPCPYGETEFALHFIHDSKYRGLCPVIAYWVTIITCNIMTFGSGNIFFICSPLGWGVETATDRWVAPYLAPKLYELMCNEEDFDATMATFPSY